MNSLEQTERAALDRRTRLWQIDQVRNDLNQQRSIVDRLTPQVDAIGQQMRVLGQLQDLAATLSPNVVGTGGARARDQVIGACAAGAKGLNSRRDRLKRQLDAATMEIPKLEAQLAAFTS
jgi:hypothetical protein